MALSIFKHSQSWKRTLFYPTSDNEHVAILIQTETTDGWHTESSMLVPKEAIERFVTDQKPVSDSHTIVSRDSFYKMDKDLRRSLCNQEISLVPLYGNQEQYFNEIKTLKCAWSVDDDENEDNSFFDFTADDVRSSDYTASSASLKLSQPSPVVFTPEETISDLADIYQETPTKGSSPVSSTSPDPEKQLLELVTPDSQGRNPFASTLERREEEENESKLQACDTTTPDFSSQGSEKYRCLAPRKRRLGTQPIRPNRKLRFNSYPEETP